MTNWIKKKEAAIAKAEWKALSQTEKEAQLTAFMPIEAVQKNRLRGEPDPHEFSWDDLEDDAPF